MTEDEYGIFYRRIGELYQSGMTDKKAIAGKINMPPSFVGAIIDEMKVRHEA